MPMPVEQLKTQVAQVCKTKSVLDATVSNLHRMSSASYALNFTLQDYMQSNFSPELYGILFHELSSRDPRALGAYINALTMSFSTCTVLKLTLAFVPDYHYVGLLYDWFKTHTKIEDFVLDVVSDPAIVAGIVIDYKGVHFDMSSVAKIDAVFQGY